MSTHKDFKKFTDAEFEADHEDDDTPEENEIATKPLKLTPDILKRDQRKTDIVEVNLSTGEARVVEKSGKPKLAIKHLKEKGAPIQTPEIVFDGETLEIDVWHGKSLALDIAYQDLLDTYQDPKRVKEKNKRLKQIKKKYKGAERKELIKQLRKEFKDLELSPKLLKERDDAVKRLLLSGGIADPVFSYQGVPADGYPIEEVSQVLLGALWQAYMGVNNPVEPDWYSVEVLRGVPLETSVLLGGTFESYPVRTAQEDNETPIDDVEMLIERSDAQRSILVSSMIQRPRLSFNGEGATKTAYPVEKLSEKMMQCLWNAYRVANVSEARLDMLSRFPQPQPNGEREVGNN